MPRILGVDYGLKRIGIAISDPAARIASPERILSATGAPDQDAAAVMHVADELEAERIVVGLPLNMDGSDSEQTKATRAFGEALQSLTDRPIAFWDERLSSHAAESLLAQRSLTRKKRKARQDAVAAAIILDGYLASLQTERG